MNELPERRLSGRTGVGLRVADAYDDALERTGGLRTVGVKKHVSHTRHDTACDDPRDGEVEWCELEWIDDAGDVGDPREGMSSDDERGVTKGVPTGVEGSDSSLRVHRSV